MTEPAAVRKSLPRNLTTYDLLKSFAVVLMIADHLGYYLFPDLLWLRVLGRLCVPVWFFLIGYARSRDLSAPLWIGSMVLLVGNIVAGMALAPLNILATIIIIRLTIDPIMRFALKRPLNLASVAIALALFDRPAGLLWEYGTEAMLLAIAGYMLRHRAALEKPTMLLPVYFVVATAVYVASQWYNFKFSPADGLILSVGCFMTSWTLYSFRPATLPRLTAMLPQPAVRLLRLTGRHTLAIYVMHLLILKGLGLYLDPQRFILYDWKLYAMGGM